MLNFISLTKCVTHEICLTLNPIFQGTVLGITGPTLTEMTLKLKSTYEDISLAYSLKGLGMLAGAPFGGHVTDKFRSLYLFTD